MIPQDLHQELHLFRDVPINASLGIKSAVLVDEMGELLDHLVEVSCGNHVHAGINPLADPIVDVYSHIWIVGGVVVAVGSDD